MRNYSILFGRHSECNSLIIHVKRNKMVAKLTQKSWMRLEFHMKEWNIEKRRGTLIWLCYPANSYLCDEKSNLGTGGEI